MPLNAGLGRRACRLANVASDAGTARFRMSVAGTSRDAVPTYDARTDDERPTRRSTVAFHVRTWPRWKSGSTSLFATGPDCTWPAFGPSVSTRSGSVVGSSVMV